MTEGPVTEAARAAMRRAREGVDSTYFEGGREFAKQKAADKQERLESEQARKIRDFWNRPKCPACGGPMVVVGRRGMHEVCDPQSIIGRACTCRPKCSETTVGDKGMCNPECEVCTKRVGWQVKDWHKAL